ncbi:MAG: DUF1492 domain-containing protein [Desulfitobacteriia bacterium]|jgi:DNA-directed RNA polymerase specialized sigma subunit
MNAKEYLSQAFWLDQRINSKLEQLESLRSLATKVTTNLSQEKVSCGNDVTKIREKTIVKIIDLENEIDDDIDKLVDLKADIMEAIGQVDEPICQLLLEMRYINGKTWEEVASVLGIDIRTAFRLHGKSLKEIEHIKNCQ